MTILGIETSCDETAAAIAVGKGNEVKIISNIVSSQINIHKKYGGVVPEVAAREHVLKILPVINEALAQAGISRDDCLSAVKKKARLPIDAIAVTTGPGLSTALLVGVETAKVLSYAWRIPAIPINHIEGHIYANYISGNREFGIRNLDNKNSITTDPQFPIPNSQFPIVILTVSGGHTMLVLMASHGKFKTVGDTLDDAAGEAFDKAAQILGLGYPGGPEISKLASRYLPKSQITNHKSQIKLPRPMLDRNNFHFSFSGLKTALLYQVQRDKEWKRRIPEYAHEFQQAVIDVLVHKTIRAAENYNVNTIFLAGGVSANQELRKQMRLSITEQIPDSNFLIPDLAYCTDNAAMVAAAGYFKARDKKYTPWQKLSSDCTWEL